MDDEIRADLSLCMRVQWQCRENVVIAAIRVVSTIGAVGGVLIALFCESCFIMVIMSLMQELFELSLEFLNDSFVNKCQKAERVLFNEVK